VNGRRVEGANEGEVVRGAVTAVAVKRKFGESEVVFLHQEVTEGFGEDGGGADFRADAIAVGDANDGGKARDEREGSVHEDGGGMRSMRRWLTQTTA